MRVPNYSETPQPSWGTGSGVNRTNITIAATIASDAMNTFEDEDEEIDSGTSTRQSTPADSALQFSLPFRPAPSNNSTIAVPSGMNANFIHTSLHGHFTDSRGGSAPDFASNVGPIPGYDHVDSGTSVTLRADVGGGEHTGVHSPLSTSIPVRARPTPIGRSLVDPGGFKSNGTKVTEEVSTQPVNGASYDPSSVANTWPEEHEEDILPSLDDGTNRATKDWLKGFNRAWEDVSVKAKAWTQAMEIMEGGMRGGPDMWDFCEAHTSTVREAEEQLSCALCKVLPCREGHPFNWHQFSTAKECARGSRRAPDDEAIREAAQVSHAGPVREEFRDLQKTVNHYGTSLQEIAMGRYVTLMELERSIFGQVAEDIHS